MATHLRKINLIPTQDSKIYKVINSNTTAVPLNKFFPVWVALGPFCIRKTHVLYEGGISKYKYGQRVNFCTCF